MNDPNKTVSGLAVKKFTVIDRLCLYGPILPRDKNESTTQSNQKAVKSGTIKGVAIQRIKDVLNTNYVDLEIVEKAIGHFNSFQADAQKINITSNPVNAVFTEAVHQFQLKSYIGFKDKKDKDKKDHDGVIGDSTLDSLGFIFHLERKNFSGKSANDEIKKKFKEIDAEIKKYITGNQLEYLGDINGRNWFDHIINPTIFGSRGKDNRGFHKIFVLKLRRAESKLLNDYKQDLYSLRKQYFDDLILRAPDAAIFKNYYPNIVLEDYENIFAQMSEAWRIRKDSAKWWRRFGHYQGNLRISEALFEKIVEAMDERLRRVMSQGYYNSPLSGSFAGVVTEVRAPSLLGRRLDIDEMHGDIRTVSSITPYSFHLSGLAIDIKYFRNPHLGESDAEGAITLRHLRSSSPDVIASEERVRNKSFSKTQQFLAVLGENYTTREVYNILQLLNNNYRTYFNSNRGSKEYREAKANYMTGGRAPENGFLSLEPELVTTLRDDIGLAWGAVDLAASGNGNGDMMHFDMRTSSIGFAYNKAIGEGGRNEYLKKVHPRHKTNASTPETELFEAQLSPASNWFDQVMAKLMEYAFGAAKGTIMLPYLISLYQNGEKDPKRLTDRVYYDILYPNQKGNIIKNHWTALYNYLVTPFLLSAGRAVKTLKTNLLIPNPSGTPFILAKNQYDLVLFPDVGTGFARYSTQHADVYKHPISGIKGAHGDSWVDPQTGADFYNAIQDFRVTPAGQNVIVHYGDISAYKPSINLGHSTHNQGKAIDMHYLGSAGQELTGATAYQSADVAKMNAFFTTLQQYSFNNFITYGGRFTHPGNKNHADHKNHFHIAHS